MVCTARSPKCEVCPIRNQCRWVALGKPTPTEQQQLDAKQRVQKFAGTDRQVRGIVMGLLRRADASGVAKNTIDAAWPDKVQLWRAADSLVADGLAREADDRLFLPH